MCRFTVEMRDGSHFACSLRDLFTSFFWKQVRSHLSEIAHVWL